MINVLSRSLISFLTLLFFINSLWASPTGHHHPFFNSNLSYGFVESVIATAPRETVQICVDRKLGETGFRKTEIECRIKKVAPRAFDNVRTKTLYFPAWAMQTCFSLELDNSSISDVYEIHLEGTSEVASIRIISGEKKFLECGVLEPSPITNPSPNQELNIEEELQLLDRFGNTYSSTSTDVNMGGDNLYCSSDLFNLFVEPGLGNEYSDVACQVLGYLTDLFEEKAGTADCPAEKINIYFSYYDDPTSAIGAIGSPYYTRPDEGCPKVLYGRPFVKLNGGKMDRLTSSPLNSTADGQLRINLHPNNLSYNTDSTIPTPADQYDLYTTLLHESMHIFEFASLMYRNNPPDSYLTFYTAWDRHLNLQKGTQSHSFLIDGCENNCWNRNPEVFNGFSQSPCGENNCVAVFWNTPDTEPILHFDNPSVAPIAGVLPTGTYEVTNFLNALSHIGGYEGDFQDYVMVPARPNGPEGDLRQLSSEELDILCKLGVSIPTNTECDACVAIANHDNTYAVYYEGECDAPADFFVCSGEAFTIDETTLLANDLLHGSAILDLQISNIELVNEDLSYIIITDIGNGFTVESPYNGLVEFSYTVYSNSCDCKPHTSTFWVAFDHCTNCNEDVCESYLCVTDFEDIPISFLPFNEPIQRELYLENPFLFTEESGELFPLLNQNTPDVLLDQTLDNKYLRIAAPNQGEGLALTLIEPFEVGGCDLELTIDISSYEVNGVLQVWGSSEPPCLPINGTISNQCGVTSDCGDYLFTSHCLAELPIISTFDDLFIYDEPQLQTQSIIFSYEEDEPLNYLFLILSNAEFFCIDNPRLRQYCSPNFSWQGECAENETFFTSDIPELPGVTHSWFFGDGIGTSVLTNPTYTYSLPGTYDITHVVTDECGRITQSIASIKVLDCTPAFACPCPTEINLDAGTGTLLSSFIADGSMPAGGITNACLAIKGNLIIDPAAMSNGFYTVSTSEMKMQPGSKITILADAALSVQYSSDQDGDGLGGIHGCDQMWQGIHLAEGNFGSNGGRLQLYTTSLRDAVHGVYLNNASIFEMSYTLMERNHIGIYVPPSSNLKYVVQPTFPYNSTIRGQEELLSPYPQQAVQTGIFGKSGAEINDCKFFQLGGSTFGVTISHLDFGIIADYAGVYLVNSTIHDLREQGETTSTGVFLNNGAYLFSGNNRYFNMRDGILGEESRVTAYGNIFGEDLQGNQGNLENGIDVSSAVNGIIDVANLNHFYTQGFGMRLRSASSAGYININNNDFDLISPDPGIINSACISLIDGLDASPDAEYLIANNRMELHDNGRGIELSNMNSVNIESNRVEYLTDSPAFNDFQQGISLVGANDNYIFENTIISPNDAVGRQGIWVQGSISNALCCNITDGTDNGVVFDGICNSTLLRHTQLIDNNRGLVCEMGTRIGPQIVAGNTWTGTFDIQAAHLSLNIEDVNFSSFLVNPPPGTSTWPTNLQVLSGVSNWFRPSFLTLSNCEDDVYCDPGVGSDPKPFDELNAQAVIDRSFEYGNFGLVSQWEAERELYRIQRVFAPQEMSTWDLAVQNFYQSQVQGNSNLYLLDQVESGLKGLYAIDTDVLLSQEELHTAIIALATVDAVFVDGVAPSQVYLDQRAVQIEAIQDKSEEVFAKMTNKVTSNLATVANLEAVNAGIIVDHNAAALQKIVNHHYLQSIAKNQTVLSVSASNGLLYIAEQCPEIAGAAVYRARSILKNFNHTYTEPNCDLSALLTESNLTDMSTSESHKSSRQPTKLIADWLIYPNPASSEITVDVFFEVIMEPYTLMVTNSQGKVVYSQKYSDSRTKINSGEFPSGMYFITLKNKEHSLTKRIIIQ